MPLDQFGRNINYLRVSLTDRCNLRCLYCMPEKMVFRPEEHVMSDGELFRMVRLFAETGFSKFRLTGGEPTLRSGIVDIVRAISGTSGVKEVVLTTNAVKLDRLARPLKEAGLSRINVSIDSLHPDRFSLLTRGGKIEKTLKGIRAAEAVGFPIKLNAVVMKGRNDGDDVVDLARLTLTYPWQIRFIEMMPFGAIAGLQKAGVVTQSELYDKITRALGPLELLHGGELDGETLLYQLADGEGTIGFISSVSNPFCAGCNRARLTADGKLRLCLLSDKEIDLLSPMRAGASDEALKTLVTRGIHGKPWGHRLVEGEHPENRIMSEIGG